MYIREDMISLDLFKVHVSKNAHCSENYENKMALSDDTTRNVTLST